MKNIFLIIILSIFSGHWAEAQSITVKCPPCRPVTGCDLCWETQQQADEACSGNARKGETVKENVINGGYNSISIYPNPNKNEALMIRNNSEHPGEVMIVNQLGIQVKRFKLKGLETYKIDHLSLPVGLYHIVFKNESGAEPVMQRLIIIH